MEGFLPQPVVTFLNGAKHLGVTLNWSISSSEQKKSVVLEWNVQPERSIVKYTYGHKSPSRRRRDALRHQAWRNEQRTPETAPRNREGNNKGPNKPVQHPRGAAAVCHSATPEQDEYLNPPVGAVPIYQPSRASNTTPSPVDMNKALNRQVRDPQCHKPGKGRQKRYKQRKHRPAVGLAPPKQDHRLPPVVGSILPDGSPSKSTRSSQTDRQVTHSCEVQTDCSPVESTNASAQTETVATNGVLTQTWKISSDQATQTAGNGAGKVKLLADPRYAEPSGLDFADRSVLKSLRKKGMHPESLPYLPTSSQHNTCLLARDTCLTMQVSYGQTTYERHTLASDYISHDVHLLVGCIMGWYKRQGTRPYLGEPYLLTKYSGQHYLIPSDACYTDLKPLARADLLSVTLVFYDFEKGRYNHAVPPEV